VISNYEIDSNQFSKPWGGFLMGRLGTNLMIIFGLQQKEG
jgi:hypothetical protein